MKQIQQTNRSESRVYASGSVPDVQKVASDSLSRDEQTRVRLIEEINILKNAGKRLAEKYPNLINVKHG